MGDRKPGPLCSSQLGPEWIDGGTMCRSRTSAPGPLGLAASFITGLVLGAAPKTAEKQPETPKASDDEKIMMEYDISTIERSPFGKTDDGRLIVQLLRKYNSHNNILYVEMTGDSPPRGEWDGEQITVNKDSYANSFKTIVELVHEASHALWRGRHKIGKGKTESTEAGGKNEYYAVKNQLAIYKWLRENTSCPPDPVLDLRLQYEKDGNLEDIIQQHERENRERR